MRTVRPLVFVALLALSASAFAENRPAPRRGVSDPEGVVTRIVKALKLVVQPLSDKISPPIGG